MKVYFNEAHIALGGDNYFGNYHTSAYMILPEGEYPLDVVGLSWDELCEVQQEEARRRMKARRARQALEASNV